MKSNNNRGIVELLIPISFPKKASHKGTKTFLCKKILGRLFKIGGLIIRSCQGLGGVS